MFALFDLSHLWRIWNSCRLMCTLPNRIKEHLRAGKTKTSTGKTHFINNIHNAHTHTNTHTHIIWTFISFFVGQKKTNKINSRRHNTICITGRYLSRLLVIFLCHNVAANTKIRITSLTRNVGTSRSDNKNSNNNRWVCILGGFVDLFRCSLICFRMNKYIYTRAIKNIFSLVFFSPFLPLSSCRCCFFFVPPPSFSFASFNVTHSIMAVPYFLLAAGFRKHAAYYILHYIV